jgi:hypothetical protein
MLVTILRIIDDAKCDEMVRHLRWPGGVRWGSRLGTDQIVR